MKVKYIFCEVDCRMRKKLEILEILLAIFIILCGIILFVKIHYMEKDLFELQQDIYTINQYSSSATETEYIQVINFLENEIAKFRDFVENQQAFLAQLIGGIGALATGMLAFLGIKGRKDISNIIQEKYAEQVENELADIIGGQDKIIYLQNCVARQKKAENKKILFVFQEKEQRELMEVYRELKDGGFQVKKKSIDKVVRDKEISSWVEDNDIIIYQVDESEMVKDDHQPERFKTVRNQPDENVTYARLARECNNKKVYGILFCNKYRGLNPKRYDSFFYISAANYGLTVMERIYNLLYFA